jgi:hypothetical protein
MQKIQSRAEARLARLLATTPPPVAGTAAEKVQIDLVYLSDADQDRLDNSIRT